MPAIERYSGTIWEYRDGPGILHRGMVARTWDFGGTDVPYMMRASCGVTTMLSGAPLRAARVLGGWPEIDPTCPHAIGQDGPA